MLPRCPARYVFGVKSLPCETPCRRSLAGYLFSNSLPSAATAFAAKIPTQHEVVLRIRCARPISKYLEICYGQHEAG